MIIQQAIWLRARFTLSFRDVEVLLAERGIAVSYETVTRDYGGFVSRADKLLQEKLHLPAGYSLKWSGEYELELRAKERLKIILPIVFLAIFMLLYMVRWHCHIGQE